MLQTRPGGGARQDIEGSIVDAIFGGPWGPLIISGLRIVDVSLSTLRILLSMRNQRTLVPLLGFFEVLVWIFAVGNAIRHLDSIAHVLGYAGGFAAGSLVGVWLEGRLAFGLGTMRIISRRADGVLASRLRALGCGVTEFTGQGREGPVEVIYTVMMRRRLPAVLAEVEKVDPDAFITVEEPRHIRRGWMQSVPRVRLPAGLARFNRRTGLERRRPAPETPPDE